MQKILITGGYGFLGTNLVHKLESINNIYIMVPTRQEMNLVSDEEIKAFLSCYKPDTIIHLAAKCGGILDNKNHPYEFIYDNLNMGLKLINISVELPFVHHFIMVGTVCSYPKFTPIPFKEDYLWSGYPEEVTAAYGIAKKTLMELLIAAHNAGKISATNLLPVNLYGPHDHFDSIRGHVIASLIRKIEWAIKNNEPFIEVWGTGNATREFLYVEDCVDAIIQTLDNTQYPWPINIGSGQEISIKDLVVKITKIMNYNGEIRFNSKYPDGQPRRCLDVTKAKQILNFSAKTSLEDGLKQTIDWYLKNHE